jgi:hypothetical protein
MINWTTVIKKLRDEADRDMLRATDAVRINRDTTTGLVLNISAIIGNRLANALESGLVAVKAEELEEKPGKSKKKPTVTKGVNTGFVADRDFGASAIHTERKKKAQAE